MEMLQILLDKLLSRILSHGAPAEPGLPCSDGDHRQQSQKGRQISYDLIRYQHSFCFGRPKNIQHHQAKQNASGCSLQKRAAAAEFPPRDLSVQIEYAAEQDQAATPAGQIFSCHGRKKIAPEKGQIEQEQRCKLLQIQNDLKPVQL